MATQLTARKHGSAPPRRRRSVLARHDAMAGLLFVLPCLVLFLVFRFGPAVAGGVLGFFDYTIGGTAEWKGLDNFRRLWEDPVFWSALRVTLVYSLIAVPVTVAAALGMALLTRRAFRGVRFFRSVFFLPVITSLVLAGAIFRWLFSAEGPWTTMLGWIGLGGTPWLESSTMVIPALALVGVWSRFGYGMLILLAALQNVPRELEEAATVDGAGAWQRFRHVVLPQLRPALFFLAVIETTMSFQAFDAIYTMTGGGPAHASFTLVFDLYEQGFKYFDLGYAGAIGVALFIMTLVVALIQRLLLGRDK
ncbi:sugar ABC transporter permease [Streptomyces sp. A7024]|uniref:Sugar ABC transporter permease n=1 Tax=Streptomyces coryli TaxID=1128680 RepID=A0A6G4TX67_9ACTN|nr:sugar ABC transporter permease [Streptomyces coryli]NGN63637.1 sugar ABC transporter permease [Streptomyces coryli]